MVTELAWADCGHPVSVHKLAEIEGISPKYLEQILKALKTAGLVCASPGQRGGYVLAQPPATITLKKIYESLVGSLAPVPCVDCPRSCPRREFCPLVDTWIELRDAIQDVMERTTIQQLVDRKRQKTAAAAQMYYI